LLAQKNPHKKKRLLPNHIEEDSCMKDKLIQQQQQQPSSNRLKVLFLRSAMREAIFFLS